MPCPARRTHMHADTVLRARPSLSRRSRCNPRNHDLDASSRIAAAALALLNTGSWSTSTPRSSRAGMTYGLLHSSAFMPRPPPATESVWRFSLLHAGGWFCHSVTWYRFKLRAETTGFRSVHWMLQGTDATSKPSAPRSRGGVVRRAAARHPAWQPWVRLLSIHDWQSRKLEGEISIFVFLFRRGRAGRCGERT